MEYCEICDQQVSHALRSSSRGRTGIACNGTSCGGTIVHAKCAGLSGQVLEALTAGRLGLFWFCERCRRPERKALAERNNGSCLELTELSAIRVLAAKMVESVDENLNQVRGLLTGRKEDKGCQWPEGGGEELTAPLPAEIWLKVFGYLREVDLLRVRVTCRWWRDLLAGCSALRGRFLPRFPKGVLIDGGYKPEYLFPAASSIFFGNARIFEVGSWWTQFGQGLTEINISECKCVLATLVTMLRETPNLKEMSWNWVMMDTVEGDYSGVDFRLDKMRKFIFKGEKDVKILNLFEKICPNLQILLFPSDDLNDSDLGHVVSLIKSVQQTLETLQITCSDSAMDELVILDQLKLKHLILDGLDITDKSVAVDLCRKMPTLTGLHIQGGFSLRGSDLTELGEALPNLECFSTHFPRQMQIRPTFLSHLPPTLKHLALVGDNEEQHTIQFTAETVGQGCPNLSHLALSELILPRDSLRQLLVKSPKITSLALQTVDIQCWSSLQAALAELPHLERLHLVMVNLLERTSVFHCNPLPSVKALKLNHCHVERDDLIYLLKVFPNLENLKLYHLDELINDGLLKIICHDFKRLDELRIVGCSLTPAQERTIYAEFGARRMRSLVISEDSQSCD